MNTSAVIHKQATKSKVPVVARRPTKRRGDHQRKQDAVPLGTSVVPSATLSPDGPAGSQSSRAGDFRRPRPKCPLRASPGTQGLLFRRIRDTKAWPNDVRKKGIVE